MVDYSRFDAIELSSEDEAEARGRRGAPTVTKLKGAHRITFGGGGDATATPIEDDDVEGDVDDAAGRRGPAVGASARDDPGHRAGASDARADEGRSTKPTSDAPPTVRDWSSVVAKLIRNGARVEGGSDGVEEYFWCQDAREATVSVVVRPGVRARDVRVRCTSTDVEIGVVGGSDRSSSFSTSDVVFSEKWAHEIDPEPRDANDSDDASEPPQFGDWEITDFEGTGPNARRIVRVTVRKKGSDMLTHWWRACVRGGPEVDPATFADRSAGKANEAKRAWEEAQRMFRERVKNRKHIEVDVPGSDDE